MTKLAFALFLISCNLFASDDNPFSFIGNTYITKKPLIYITNLPWYRKASRNIQWNAPTYYKYNRTLEEVRNACSNCLDAERLITPIRVEYIPVGSKLIVIGSFRRRSSSESARDYLIIEDELKQRSEVSALHFSLISRDDDLRLGAEDRMALEAANWFSKNERLTYRACDPLKLDTLERFRKDFKLEAEILLHPTNETFGGMKCVDFEFASLTSYLTFQHYEQEWEFDKRVKTPHHVFSSACSHDPDGKPSDPSEILCSDTFKQVIRDGKADRIRDVIKRWRINWNQASLSRLDDETLTIIFENTGKSPVDYNLCKSKGGWQDRFNCYLGTFSRDFFIAGRPDDYAKACEFLQNSSHQARGLEFCFGKDFTPGKPTYFLCLHRIVTDVKVCESLEGMRLLDCVTSISIKEKSPEHCHFLKEARLKSECLSTLKDCEFRPESQRCNPFCRINTSPQDNELMKRRMNSGSGTTRPRGR